MNAPDSILIIKPSSLGDIIHTLPALRCLKISFPQSRISWIANSEWTPLLQGNPHLDAVLPFPRSRFRGIGGWFRFLRWAAALGPLGPALALDFQGLLRSAWIARCARPNRMYGLSDAREGARFFYQRIAKVRSDQHSVERYLELARLAGAEISGTVQFDLPRGRPIENLELPRQYVLLHPFARGEGKSLSPEEIYALIRALAPVAVVVAGRSSVDFPLDRNAISLVNQTDLLQLIWLIRQASFVVSVDSGPMHIAAALTANLLSIHTWSDPRSVGPYRLTAWVWQNHRILRVSDLQNATASIAHAGARPHPIQVAAFVQEQLLQTPSAGV
jgi:ADP-heptose:LPS heptosyltransferase